MKRSYATLKLIEEHQETISKCYQNSLVILESVLSVTQLKEDMVCSTRQLRCISTDTGELSLALVLLYSGLALLHLCSIRL